MAVPLEINNPMMKLNVVFVHDLLEERMYLCQLFHLQEGKVSQRIILLELKENVSLTNCNHLEMSAFQLTLQLPRV